MKTSTSPQLKTISRQLSALASRLRSRPIVSLIGVVALLLAGGFGLFATLSRGGSNAVAARVATHEVVNIAGGYRFEAPDGWSTTQEDRTTTVTSPDRATVITLGLGRTGSLPVAGAVFFQQVGGNYRDVDVFPPEGKHVGSAPALVYGGTGTNAQNARVRFLAITIKNDPINFAITVFTEVGSDPKTVLPQANRVVDTFRALPPS